MFASVPTVNRSAPCWLQLANKFVFSNSQKPSQIPTLPRQNPKNSQLFRKFRSTCLPPTERFQSSKGIVNLEPSPETPVEDSTRKMESSESRKRLRLSDVVADCVKRWFDDTLKEAKAGDSSMQILVGQMYYSGYGVKSDTQKGTYWMTKASKSRSSAWRVCDKRPGYGASDSDSDDTKGDAEAN